MGRTTIDRLNSPINQLFRVKDDLRLHDEEATDASGRILGTYLHGLPQNPGLRNVILDALAVKKGIQLPSPTTMESRDDRYGKLAALLRSSLDMDLIYRDGKVRSDSRLFWKSRLALFGSTI